MIDVISIECYIDIYLLNLYRTWARQASYYYVVVLLLCIYYYVVDVYYIDIYWTWARQARERDLTHTWVTVTWVIQHTHRHLSNLSSTSEISPSLFLSKTLTSLPACMFQQFFCSNVSKETNIYLCKRDLL